jgi:hypothetical protein
MKVLSPLVSPVLSLRASLCASLLTSSLTALVSSLAAFVLSVLFAVTAPNAALAQGSQAATVSLRDSSNQASYLIVAHPDFVETIERDFAAWRRSKGYVVRVVSLADVYREFPNAKAQESLRAFTSHVIQTWRKPLQRSEPLYILLVGSAALVPSYRVPVSVEDFMLPSLLAREDTVSLDDVFTVPFGARNTLPQAAIGRFPASTKADIQAIVAKTKQFEDDRSLRYASDIVGVTDAKDYYNFEPAYNSFLTEIAKAQRSAGRAMAQAGTRDMRVKSFTYRENTVNELTRSIMLSAVKEGTMFWIYYGHGAPDLWSELKIVTTGDINDATLPKQTKPFITMSIGCQQNFDNLRGKPSIVEHLVNREGGAVATFAAAGFGLLSEGNVAVTAVMETLLGDAAQKYTLGSAVLEMKRFTIAPLPALDDFYRRLSILGDPALRIPLQTLTSVEQQQLVRQTALGVAPNPVSGDALVSFTLQSPATTRLEVFSLTGERLWTAQPRTLAGGTHTERIDASTWASGAYQYRLVITNSSGSEQAVSGVLHVVR